MTPRSRIAALALSGLCHLPLPASALTEDLVLRPYVDQIALCGEALRELQRQGDLRQSELEAWLANARAWSAEMERNAARLAEQHDLMRGRAESAVAAAPGLRALGHEASHVPHIGWGIFGFFEQHRDNTNRAIAEAEAGFRDGQLGFHVASTGWLNANTLREQIDQAQQAIAALRTSLDEGSFGIHYPGLGWVNRVGLTDCQAQQAAAMAAVRAQIAAGDYGVHLPHIGWTTRNQVLAMIDQARAELAAIEAQVAAQELGIARSPGWITGLSVQTRIQELDTARSDLEAQVGAGGFAHALPGIGWITGQGLADRIAQIEGDIAGVRASVAAGTYGVPAGGGWTTANDARAALAQPDCRPEGPIPCLDPQARPVLQDALARIPPTADFDIAYREMERRYLIAEQGALGQHAAPALMRIATERRVMERLQGEFAQELALYRSRIERRIDWLNQNLAEIP